MHISRGVIIGRFNPPHVGHQCMIHFALSQVDELYIFLCTLESDEIPASLRVDWMKLLFPTAHVVHIDTENPNASRDEPDAYKIWSATVREHVPAKNIDFVFASEGYGKNFACELSAQFINVDSNRNYFPVSSSKIRNNPMKYWDYLPLNIRPWFVKRILVSAEQGEQEIIRTLAKMYRTVSIQVFPTVEINESQDFERRSSIDLDKMQKSFIQTLCVHARYYIFIAMDAYENHFLKVKDSLSMDSEFIDQFDTIFLISRKHTLSAHSKEQKFVREKKVHREFIKLPESENINTTILQIQGMLLSPSN